MKTKTEYKQLKKQIEDKYKRAIAAAEAELNESLNAIDKVWYLYHPQKPKQSKELTPSLPQQTDTDTTTAAANNENINTPLEYGSFNKTVKASLAFVPREKFKRSDVLTALRQSLNNPKYYCNQASLSNCLKGLANEGVIEIIKQGRGSSPSEYRLKGTVLNEPMKTNTE